MIYGRDLKRWVGEKKIVRRKVWGKDSFVVMIEGKDCFLKVFPESKTADFLDTIDLLKDDWEFGDEEGFIKK